MSCASQASQLLSVLPYGVTVVAALAISRFTGKHPTEADHTPPSGQDGS